MRIRALLPIVLLVAGFASVTPAQAEADVHAPKPAVVRGSFWYLRDSATSGAADHVFQYGDPGDVAFFGDWNGDGVKTPGVFRSGVWYLRNSNDSGTADVSFTYGNAAYDVPVVGDWDGDGVDTPGVVRGNEWLLRNSAASGSADTVFTYGDLGDVPIVGDWDGDGVDTPAIGRWDPQANELVSTWHIRNENSTGAEDGRFDRCSFDRPVPGAWLGGTRDVCADFELMYAQWIFRGSSDEAYDYFVFGNPDDVALRWN